MSPAMDSFGMILGLLWDNFRLCLAQGDFAQIKLFFATYGQSEGGAPERVIAFLGACRDRGVIWNGVPAAALAAPPGP